ncbi:hypothetical protein E8E13_000897 [Curvularia kusanoi]|uniref:Cytochrome P450 oxidoreductase n=1 Tax=Curvularia kusanoi TaxID=90978 RepID=A0A9P4W9J5_CURKU|nr:hypothetical protein E8E13_000897 [Curvularia kusanoi]
MLEHPAQGNTSDARSVVIATSHLSAQYIVCGIFLAFVAYRAFTYFTSELPPFGSGLKRLPGPRSTLPYLGRVHDVDRMRAWNAMRKFSDEYKGLYALTLGGETHIWVAREDIAQDLLVNKASISSARADLGAYPGVTHDYKYLPLLGYTKTFERQKRFAHSVMTRNMTHNYFGYIDLETKRLLHELVKSPNEWWQTMHLHCARISSRLAYGFADRAQEHVTNAGMFLNQIGPSGPFPNLVPFLRHFPELLVPGKRGVRVRQENEARLWYQLFEKSKARLIQGEPTATYTSASVEARAIGGTKVPWFENEKEAQCAVGMLCTVSIYTIAGPATLFVMAMILHPLWQEKVRKQIDEVVGDGLVELRHSPQLPFLRAAIKECVRWKSTVPLGVPRLLSEDYAYDGYHFPKGAVVHVLDIALSQDPDRYKNPDVYDPDRWLNEASPNYRAPLTEYPRLKGHHIFGRGKRVCPGQDLTEAELIVMCGNLLKFFTLAPAVDARGEVVWPDPDKWTTDVIGGPLPFQCEIKVRDEEKLDLVEILYREAFA